jgi:hypothetical protein
MLSLLHFLATITGTDLIAALSESEQAFIIEQIESRQDPLSGPGIIVDFAELPLGNGGGSGSLVLYMYQSGENRDRSGAMFLTLVRHNDDELSATPPMLIGINGRRIIDDLEVSGTNIVLKGRYWQAGDAQCCPSAQSESLMTFDGERLLEMSGRWERQAVGP